jgi:hypothetical protein
MVIAMPTEAKIVRCECGYEARSTHVEELVEALLRHGADSHRIEFTRKQALQIIRRCGGTNSIAAGDRKP